MDRDKLWNRFVFLMSVESFGEKEVITEGKKQRMFLGSVEKHKKVFDAAWNELTAPIQPVEIPWPDKAQTEGFCRACGGTIKVGEEITTWGAPDDPGRWIHRKHPRKPGHEGNCACFLTKNVALDDREFDVGGEG